MSTWARIRAALIGIVLTAILTVAAVLMPPSVVADGVIAFAIMFGVCTLTLIFLAAAQALSEAFPSDEDEKPALQQTPSHPVSPPRDSGRAA